MSKASSEFMQECDGAPRLNEMFEFFSATAAGSSGAPAIPPVVDVRLMQHDARLLKFAEKHRTLWGHFDPHFFSSIPYVLEEEVRRGDALLEYGKSKQRSHSPVGYYVLGGAEGTLARTLGCMARGAILTLSCSPNQENEASFLRHGRPQFSSFFHGPFHRLTSAFLTNDTILKPLHGKFDIILEDTTFQMYSPNRSAQIGFVKQYLKEDGIFLFVEKFRHHDSAEYVRRELQKDYGYKARYFSADEIAQKNKVILERMNLNEVTIEAMAAALGEHFDHACVTWNSGNFYAIAASNDAENLTDLVGRMCEPCIPHEYSYQKLPSALPGFSIDLPSFRHVKREP
jgi:hypothetical protein